MPTIAAALRLETPYFLRRSSCLIWLISFVFPARVVYCMLDLFLHTIYMKRAEKWTDILRFLWAGWHHGEIVNGYAPFFWRKSLDISKSGFPMWTGMLRFLCDFGIHHTSLATGERQCSVFSSDFQRFRRYWTDMLRFFSRFQADFQLKSGWIEPRLVGGYAPFSPHNVNSMLFAILI